jgi:predicted nucleotidyltransferase
MSGFLLNHAYPTVEHEAAAEAIVAFFRNQPETEAVLLVNSCARGKATPDSCLDVLVLAPVEEVRTLDARWRAFFAHEEAFRRLRRTGKFSELHLDIADGVFIPIPHDIDLGFDDFELNIGNALVYSVPLYQRGSRLRELRGKWLPYYGEELRVERLDDINRACRHHLDHIPSYVARDLYFQSFDRFYTAFGLFLQALFIARRIYPIAYNKWIREQVEDILGLPELYAQLPRLFEIERFESGELVARAERLRDLLDGYACPSP